MRSDKADQAALRYGLIGGRLSHSHSKTVHALLGDYPYALYELAEKDIGDFLRAPDIGGLNVTIPYKKTVMPFCDMISDEAKQIGSVNTLIFRNGKIFGYNTDYMGFLAMTTRAGISFAQKKVLILGSGGTGVMVEHAARNQGARDIVMVSRTGEVNYTSLIRHLDSEIIVNTTPVGMSPDLPSCPITLSDFQGVEAVIDVIYNPLRTALLLEAEKRGILFTNGLPMLVYQAAYASELFTNQQIPKDRAEAALSALLGKVTNIVLIGMPGAGKTQVGRRLSDQMERELVDTDELITKATGMPVSSIIKTRGEAAFRALEENAVLDAAKRSGVIIATGGGVILSEKNRAHLSQNGRIYFLDRPVSMLETAGRPLSIDLWSLAEQRNPIYRAMCDVSVKNDSMKGVMEVTRWIMEDFYENFNHKRTEPKLARGTGDKYLWE